MPSDDDVVSRRDVPEREKGEEEGMDRHDSIVVSGGHIDTMGSMGSSFVEWKGNKEITGIRGR